jgi:pimeloyl-ACP methyl ester carboxylesterase
MPKARFAVERKRFQIFVALFLALITLYASACAYVLRFEIDRVLFPQTIGTYMGAAEAFHIHGKGPNELIVRRFGSPKQGCVVFFPGQHGNGPKYERTLFPSYVAEGIAVFAVAYPGQDGASGRGALDEVRGLVRKALRVVANTCSPDKTVLIGRSLGSMIAAYAANDTAVAGLVIEGAAPSLSLSASIRVWLRSKWWLAPLGQLPIASLISTDFSLGDALNRLPNFPVVVIQGEDDDVTPIVALRGDGVLPMGTRLIAIQGGTYSTTYMVAPRVHVESVLEILGRLRSDLSPQRP